MRNSRTKFIGAETGSASRSAHQLLQRLQTLEYTFSVAPLHDLCMIEMTLSERPRLSLTLATWLMGLMASVPVGPGGKGVILPWVPGLCLLCWGVGLVSPSYTVIVVGTKFACTTLGQLSEHPSPPCLSSLSSGSREQMEGTDKDGNPSMRLRVYLLLLLTDVVSSCNM